VLNNPASDPINYAIRGAVADLSKMEGYDEVAQRFFPAAVEPFIFEGKTYALPETFSFPMFFYRKDIFEEYGWEVPQTFKEMKSFTAELQSKDMNMSLPGSIVGYGTVLYQNGGEFYAEGGKRTLLDSDLALSSFEEYMKWFTLYTLPASYSFVNRFRTGEMPCGIEDYTTYNTLVVFAPEIAGSWEMVPIPGTIKENGEIDRSTVGSSIGTMITEQSTKKEMAWEFVKWWLSDDIQSDYGRNLESILGSAAKYNTANKNALKRMTWSYQEYNALTEQAEWAKAVPEVPGGYYLPRTIGFAFNRSYNSNAESSVGEDPTEVMKDYIFDLNEELTRKRREFGLED
jgi:ABC-type glycerol-3-phosphate transport system substrate-binding protein